MKRKTTRKKPLPLHEKAFTAFKVAVRKAIRERTRAGLPVYIERDGKIVNINRKRRRAA